MFQRVSTEIEGWKDLLSEPEFWMAFATRVGVTGLSTGASMTLLSVDNVWLPLLASGIAVLLLLIEVRILGKVHYG